MRGTIFTISQFQEDFTTSMFHGDARHFSIQQLSCLIVPDKIQPKQVCKAIGEPGGHCCRPWRTTQLNMSTPRIALMFPKTSNSWSTRRRPDRCFQIKWHWWCRQFSCNIGNHCSLYLPLRPRRPSHIHWFVIRNSECYHGTLRQLVLRASNASDLNTLALTRQLQSPC